MSLPPFVTRCFNKSIENSECPEISYLSLFPHIAFLLLLPFQIFTLHFKRKQSYKPGKWILLEMTFFLCIILISLLEIALKHKDLFALEIALISLIAFTMCLALLSLLISDYAKRRYNGLVITYLLAEFCFKACLLLKMSLRGEKFPIYEALRAIFLLLLNVALLRPLNDDKVVLDTCPSDYTGFHRTLLISWFTHLVSLGYKKSLIMDDLFKLPLEGSSKALMKRWKKNWEYEIKTHPISPSIFLAICRCFQRFLLFISALRFFGDVIFVFMNPLLLGWLISSVSTPSSPISFALLCAIGLFLISEMRSLLNSYYIHGALRFTVYVQTILSNSIFQKTLNLSPASRGDHTVGELVNLMAVDLEKISAFVPFATEAISTPLQLLLSMGVLTTVLGAPALGGLAVVLIVIVLNLVATRFIKYFQVKQMVVKDERSKMCNEIKYINDLFSVGILKRMSLVARVIDAINAASPFLVAMIVFGIVVFTSSGSTLTPEVVFVALSIFNQLKLPMRLFALTYTYMVQARVSQKRIERFLAEEEIASLEIPPATPGLAIDILKANFNWSGLMDEASLSSVSLSVRKGEFVGIVGEVGAGKSSLLAAILGEMVHLDGQIRISGNLAYAPQQPWIQNTTLRNNITLGKDFNRKLYKKVLHVSELESDFAQMEHGDLTEIGENGVTLSGGQKARVAIARALYQECDVLLFDDVLSAVDAHVGAAIFAKIFSQSGMLRNHTRLLVTHGLHYTKSCDRVIVMEKGGIHAIGTYQELEKSDPLFIKLLMKEKENKLENKREDQEIEENEPAKVRKRITSVGSSVLSGDEEEGKIIKKENLETGRVSTVVYMNYIRAMTLFFSFLILLSQFASVGFAIWRSLWLSHWSDQALDGITDSQTKYRLAGFTILGFFESFCILISSIGLVMGCQGASLRLHSPLLHSILRSPMTFFDTTPVGRILNRLTRDLEVIDNLLPYTIASLLQSVMQLILGLAMICISIPPFIAAVIPFLLIYFFIMRYFIATARQLKRIESINRSPILAKFGEAVHGAASIRAFKRIEQESMVFSHFVDEFARCRFLSFTANRWLGVRLELLCTVTTFLAAILGVILSRVGSLSPSMLGLSISYSMTISDVLYFGVRMLSELETYIVSVERIDEYSKLEEEKAWRLPNPPPRDWPNNGKIEWKDYSLRYRSELPLVLRNFTASSQSAEKVAIVGRTGSGKSSLTIGLYRLVEPADGFLMIDGVNVAEIGLHDLRERLTIIPQEPILFSGTIRFNLDPFDEQSDEEIWMALEECQLKDFISSTPEKLNFKVSESGANMSVGQRQLICLGRALLRKSRILVLDEATAACDPYTDSIVQAVIRKHFATSTVLGIAHRLDTIADYDRVMVLADGRLCEFDSPRRLLENPNSLYTKLVEKAKTQS
ncbi:unnamed protein product, partial [Mesorhabditis belari]|uniref:Uncharacterized protein n=1 Tax=Mesorhabditis belari TaxID=2138241 RepID=A0AAF3FDM3_9BILA